MTKEQQNLAWACLPKEARDNIGYSYKNSPCGSWEENLFEEIYGEHNLTSDTEPEEMLTVSRSMIQNKYAYNENILKFDPTHQGAILLKKNFDFLFGDKCLPDKEPLKIDAADSLIAMAKDEMGITDEQPKPKFKVEDLALVKEGYAKGSVITIKAINIESPISYKSDIKDDGIAQWFLESMLEPYTDEKGKYTEESGNNSEIPNQNKEPMEEKELNLCELLNGCEGMEIFNIEKGTDVIAEVDDNTISFVNPNGRGNIVYIGKSVRTYPSGSALFYPSRSLYEKYPLDAKKAWMEWKESRKPKRWRAKSSVGVAVSECEGHWEDYTYWYITSEGVIVQDEETNCKADNLRYNIGNYFRTEEEALQAAEAVRETLEKVHSNHTEQ